MKITNINNTAKNHCSCGKWINHWNNHKSSTTTVDTCMIEGCNNKKVEGAHVQKYNNKDKDWYIIPLCHKHNMAPKGDILKLKKGYRFARANKATTCEKNNPN